MVFTALLAEIIRWRELASLCVCTSVYASFFPLSMEVREIKHRILYLSTHDLPYIQLYFKHLKITSLFPLLMSVKLQHLHCWEWVSKCCRQIWTQVAIAVALSLKSPPTKHPDLRYLQVSFLSPFPSHFPGRDPFLHELSVLWSVRNHLIQMEPFSLRAFP